MKSFQLERRSRVLPKRFANNFANFLRPCKSKLQKPMHSGVKILITTVCNLRESVNGNQYTPLALAAITVCWVCWSQITFTGFGWET